MSRCLLSRVARVRRLWLRYECVDLIHGRVRQACVLLTLGAALQHSQQVICLRHLRLLGSLLHRSISRSSNGQKSLEFFRTIHWRRHHVSGRQIHFRFVLDNVSSIYSMCDQLFFGLRNRLVLPLLLANPLLDVAHERSHHVELVRVAVISFISIAPNETRQIP